MKMTTAVDNNGNHYGIGAVVKMTGLTDHTIRMWERRYGAVVTQRAANGRRVYSAADVEKLGYLKRLTDQGFSIGQIAANTIGELRKQVQSISAMATAEIPKQIALAVLGDYLPAQLSAHTRDISPLEVRVADSNRDRFAADLRCHRADVVILESPVLDSETITQVLEYMQECGAERGVIVYSFGRARDIDMARQRNLVVVRAPVDVNQLEAAVVQSYTQSFRAKAPVQKTPREDDEQWRFSGSVAPRRFNQQQLANLANTSSAIDCECPQHLAQLVSDLSAFEIYSANCANRDDDDAALHRYLQQTTAQARALIEVALERVADAEGLRY
jgi:DNA-binding transcriptional MerR regulator